jgi:GNAT superfamily N-acetyltransferase
MRIVRARPEHATRIRNVHVRSIRLVCGPHYTAAQIEAWAGGRPARAYRDVISRGTERMFVAIHDGRVIGFSSARDGEVVAVYVDPRHLLRGAGSRLLAAAERAAGRTRLWLDATINAVPFSRSHGYRRGRRHFVERLGVPIPCVRMTKRLMA